jgi:glycosyltransferase involved in cell wall biosynthesis
MIDFSIVIPTFNNIELLKIALDSVIHQKTISYEVIVVDDSTTDEIEIFMQDVKIANIHYKRNIPSLGAVKNWNMGILLAKGESIILLHHDEYFTDKVYFLQNCLKKLKLDNCDALVLSIIVDFPDGTSKIQKLPYMIKKFILTTTPSLLYTANIIGPTSCVVFKKSVLVLFNEKLEWLVDIDWYYRLLKGNRISLHTTIYITSIFGHQNQITTNINRQEVENKDQLIIRNNYDSFSSIKIALLIRNFLFLIKNSLGINKNPLWK